MDQPVSHPSHFPPLDIRAFLSEIGRNSLGSFADNLQASGKCPLEGFICTKGIVIRGRCPGNDKVDLVQYVANELTRR